MDTLDISKLRMLLVDDYTPMRKILVEILRELGVRQIEQADTGEEALLRIKEIEPDVLIADNLMQPMDGLELTRRIRKGVDGIDPFLPIIMISGMTEKSSIIAARDAGVTEFLAKPMTVRLLYLRICSVVKTPRQFVRTDAFVGPDRRRRGMPYGDNERRETEHDYSLQKDKARDEERDKR